MLSCSLVLWLLACSDGAAPMHGGGGQGAEAAARDGGAMSEAERGRTRGTAGDGQTSAASAPGDFLAPWPPAAAGCSLVLPPTTRRYYEHSHCACVDPTLQLQDGASAGEACARDPFAEYFASFALPDAWHRDAAPTFRARSDLADGGSSFSRGPGFSANAMLAPGLRTAAIDRPLDAGSRLGYVTDGRAGEEALHEEELELDGRTARLASSLVSVSGYFNGCGECGPQTRHVLELSLLAGDGHRTVGLVGAIPLPSADPTSADPALVCELQAILASFRFEPSAPSDGGRCNAQW